MAARGALIGFVGVDGCGKTTQAGLLCQWLSSFRFDVHFLANQSLRDVRLLLDGIASQRGHRDHVAMLGAETARLVAAIVKWRSVAELPGLVARANSIVVMDRAVICQYAAVRVLGGANEDVIRDIFRALPPPDITFMLEVPAAVAAERVRRRGNERHTTAALAALAAAYRSLPEFPAFDLIDGDRPAEEVQRNLRAVARMRLPQLWEEER